MISFKLDLHVHTSRSHDAFTEFSALIQAVRKRNLDGVAITDHGICCPFTSDEILIVPGIEVSSTHGHIVGLGSREPIPNGLTPERTIQVMRNLGYIVVVPHPFSWRGGGIDPRTLKERVDAIETVNANAFPFQRCKRLAEDAATSLRVAMVGGSDSHLPQTIGDAYTEVQAKEATPDAIVTAIRSGNTIPMGHPIALTHRLSKLTHSLGL